MLTFANRLFAMVGVLKLRESAGASDDFTSFARLVLVVGVLQEELGSLLASEQLRHQYTYFCMRRRKTKWGFTLKVFLTSLVSSCHSFQATLAIYVVSKGKIGKRLLPRYSQMSLFVIAGNLYLTSFIFEWRYKMKL
jgi:hypothetical protein